MVVVSFMKKKISSYDIIIILYYVWSLYIIEFHFKAKIWKSFKAFNLKLANQGTVKQLLYVGSCHMM